MPQSSHIPSQVEPLRAEVGPDSPDWIDPVERRVVVGGKDQGVVAAYRGGVLILLSPLDVGEDSATPAEARAIAAVLLAAADEADTQTT